MWGVISFYIFGPRKYWELQKSDFSEPENAVNIQANTFFSVFNAGKVCALLIESFLLQCKMTPNGWTLEVSYCLFRHKQLSKLSKLILSYADYYLHIRNWVLKQKQRHYSTQSPQKSARLENELKTSPSCDSSGHSLPGRKQATVSFS